MNEKELIERSCQGDAEAFKELIDPLRKKIFYLCFSIVKDEKSAEDLVQEAFVRAYHSLSTFEGKSGFYTWVNHIARNLSLNYLKKRKKHTLEVLHEGMIAAPPVKEEQTSDLQEYLESSLALLEEKQRLVFKYFEIDRLSIKEIAALLDIPTGTVRSRLYYARKKIRAAVLEKLQQDQ